jgi:HK97 gp10 family phage protein
VGEQMNVQGFKELAEKMKQMAPRLAKNGLRAAVSAAAAVVRNEARNLAPVDTGEMKRDIQMKRERDKRGSADLVASYSVYVRAGKKSRLSGRARGVDKDSHYFRFVELGTSKMRAQPFLRPALELRKEDAIDAMRDKLDQRIQEEAARR